MKDLDSSIHSSTEYSSFATPFAHRKYDIFLPVSFSLPYFLLGSQRVISQAVFGRLSPSRRHGIGTAPPNHPEPPISKLITSQKANVVPSRPIESHPRTLPDRIPILFRADVLVPCFVVTGVGICVNCRLRGGGLVDGDGCA